jgi:adenosylcobinamide-GDP ribazoletransferase
VSLRAAISFLSRIPVGPADSTGLAQTLAWFSIAGGVIGAVLGLLAAVWFFVLPAWVAAFAFLPTYFGVKGVLHTDGLADCADALAAHGSPEARQRALRDPHIGVAGAIAVAVFIIALYAIIADFPRPGPTRWLVDLPLAPGLRSFPWGIVLGIVLAEVAAIMAIVVTFAIGPVASESRVARALLPGRTPQALALPLGTGTALLVVLGGLFAPAAAVLILGVSVSSALVARRALGGVSGDVLGAVHDVTFVAVFVLAAVLPWAPFL